jgi:hypothetical protein
MNKSLINIKKFITAQHFQIIVGEKISQIITKKHLKTGASTLKCSDLKIKAYIIC